MKLPNINLFQTCVRRIEVSVKLERCQHSLKVMTLSQEREDDPLPGKRVGRLTYPLNQATFNRRYN
jgi:hypothetical protein